jgi:hypothetical protein
MGNSSTVCSGRGVCLTNDVCNCTGIASGTLCQFIACNGMNISATTCPSTPSNNNLWYLFFLLAVVPVAVIVVGAGIVLIVYAAKTTSVSNVSPHSIQLKEFGI